MRIRSISCEAILLHRLGLSRRQILTFLSGTGLRMRLRCCGNSISELRRLSEVVLVLADGAGASRVLDFDDSADCLRVTAVWVEESLEMQYWIVIYNIESYLADLPAGNDSLESPGMIDFFVSEGDFFSAVFGAPEPWRNIFFSISCFAMLGFNKVLMDNCSALDARWSLGMYPLGNETARIVC